MNIHDPDAPHIAASDLQQARKEANALKRPLMQIIEEKLELQPQQAVACLARMFHYPALSMEDLDSCTPVFAVIPYTDAVDRGAVALHTRNDDLIIALADPFDGTFEWAAERVSAVSHRTCSLGGPRCLPRAL